MDIKDFIQAGQVILDDTVKSISEKIKESDIQSAVFEKSAQLVMDTTEIVGETVKKTMKYAETKRIIPGSKEKYIQQLESEIEKKEAEIKRLKKVLKRERWRNHR